jgi:hypothetical protein
MSNGRGPVVAQPVSPRTMAAAAALIFDQSSFGTARSWTANILLRQFFLLGRNVDGHAAACLLKYGASSTKSSAIGRIPGLRRQMAGALAVSADEPLGMGRPYVTAYRCHENRRTESALLCICFDVCANECLAQSCHLFGQGDHLLRLHAGPGQQSLPEAATLLP